MPDDPRSLGRRRVAAGVVAASLWALAVSIALGSAAVELDVVRTWSWASMAACVAIATLAGGTLPALLALRVGAPGRVGLSSLTCVALTLAIGVSPTAPQLLLFGVVAGPAQLFAGWTVMRQQLGARNTLHAVAYALLLAWDLPWLVLTAAGDPLSGWSSAPPWVRSTVAQSLCIPGALGIAAAIEYTRRGNGSPMPLDPPTNLVTTGPFAYVANPFQVAKVLTLVAWAAYARSWILLGAAAVVAGVGAATTEPAEHAGLRNRFGRRWSRYRANVRPWLPRFSPWRDDTVAPARLALRAGCGPCAGLAVWLQQRAPVGLNIELVAPNAGVALPEMTYDDGPVTATGIVALARALDHLSLGWALGGWCVRLPGIATLAQLIYVVSVGATDAAPAGCDANAVHSVLPHVGARRGPSPSNRSILGAYGRAEHEEIFDTTSAHEGDDSTQPDARRSGGGAHRLW